MQKWAAHVWAEIILLPLWCFSEECFWDSQVSSLKSWSAWALYWLCLCKLVSAIIGHLGFRSSAQFSARTHRESLAHLLSERMRKTQSSDEQVDRRSEKHLYQSLLMLDGLTLRTELLFTEEQHEVHLDDLCTPILLAERLNEVSSGMCHASLRR